MIRADGYRLKDCDPFYEIIPYIMKRRYDATNYLDIDLDMHPIQKYVNQCRNNGIKMTHMAVLIAAYLRLVSQNPNLNRFVCNKRLYARNHFSVCFTTLKASNTTETVTKLYFNLDDDIFEVNRKLEAAIERDKQAETSNTMDILLKKVMRIPFLASAAIGLIKFLDKTIGLPFEVIDASPFHTSLFITNLASIRLKPVYHHIYEFGTTGMFIAIGQPEKRLVLTGEVVEETKVLPIKISADDRVESGYYYAKCFREFKKYVGNPALLEEKPEEIIRDPNVKVKNPKFIVR